MGKRKLSFKEIKFEIYTRLLNYGESDRMKEINTLLKEDPKSRILHAPGGQGWVTIDWIEKKPLPYGAPDSHRYRYLKDSLIEKYEFKYYVRKNPEKPNRNLSKETLYRLKRNLNTFYKLKRVIDTTTFLNSPYCDAIIREQGLPGLWHKRAYLDWEKDDANDDFMRAVDFKLSQIHSFMISQRKAFRRFSNKEEIEKKDYPVFDFAITLNDIEDLRNLLMKQTEYKENESKIKLRMKKLRQKEKGVEPD